MSREKKPNIFWFTKPLTKSEKFMVYGRIVYQRKKSEFSTGLQSNTDDCDKIRDKNLIGQMAIYENLLNETFIVLKHQNKPISSKVLRDLLIGKSDISTGLKSFLHESLKNVENDREYSKGTKQLYKTSITYLLEFLGTEDYQFDQLDKEFIYKLDQYLINKKSLLDENITLSRNTVSKHHSRIRTILFKAVDQGLTTNNPYLGNKVIKYAKNNIKYLTEGELAELEKLDLSHSEPLRLALDYFLFTVYAGFRFSDLYSLTEDNIVVSKNKRYFKKVQIKTADDVLLPVLKKAELIIERYNNHHERKILGRLLPALSNQKVNKYLKILQVATSIKQPLTHHMARHTCATYLLSQGYGIELVQQWLGHEDITSTKRYAKFSQKFLDKIAEELNIL